MTVAALRKDASQHEDYVLLPFELAAFSTVYSQRWRR